MHQNHLLSKDGQRRSQQLGGLLRAGAQPAAAGLISGFVVMVIGVVFTPAILRLMDTPEDVLPLAVLYLRIYFLGMPGSMVYNFGAAVLRGIGDTRRPLVFLFISGIVNVALNLLLVIQFNLSAA